ncbi:MAG: 5-formyltetrahydrofolate cyclo-ligase [Deltaproteobacteria bacterium]|nr:5-formyltetrahydrofolate cyclo-ligase [Deltaproteobacteria bacterium]
MIIMVEAAMRVTKQAIRSTLLELRRSISACDRSRWSAIIVEQALSLPEFKAASGLAIYSAAADEVATEALGAAAIAAGKIVCYPRVNQVANVLSAYRVGDMADLQPGYRGILEPIGDTPLDPAALDLVIVPGVGFDPTGRRLGRGGGHYDVWLDRVRRCRVGLAFELQIVTELPWEDHDQHVDLIVTEQRVIRSTSSVRRPV